MNKKTIIWIALFLIITALITACGKDPAPASSSTTPSLIPTLNTDCGGQNCIQ